MAEDPTLSRRPSLSGLTPKQLSELCAILDARLDELTKFATQEPDRELRIEAIQRAGLVASLCIAAYEDRVHAPLDEPAPY